MNNLEIYCLDNSELAEFEATSKGFRSDIFVKINDEYYNINIYDNVRFLQDFETENNVYGFFAIEPNIVLVSKVSRLNIIHVLNNFHTQNYFKKIKPTPQTYINTKNLVIL